MILKKQFYENKKSWERSFLDGISQDENGNFLPWMTYPAIDFLEKNLQKNHAIFEFGCGASTLFFAERAEFVKSLETREKWLEIVQNFLREKKIQNVEITLLANGLESELYENFAKNSGQKFDFIIVDSLKRFLCAKNSIDALKQGGAIILDDSQRKNYQKIFDFFAEKNFRRQDFIGIAPGDLKVKQTTFFWL